MKKMFEKFKKWNPSNYAMMLLLLAPLAILFVRVFSLNYDFWFLVNTGDEILENGFITIEPFSMHSGLSFIPQQWLVDVIFSLIFNTFGVKGIYVLFLICCYLIILIFYKLAHIVCNDNKRSFLITLIIFLIIYIFGFISTRPQIFDFILLSLELLFLESYIKKDKTKYLLFIPLISLLLINLHASMWLMIFVILIPYYFENIILKFKKINSFKLKPIIIITIISLFMGLINPYGFEAIKYLFNSYGITYINSFITEMQPTVITEWLGLFIYIIIFIILYSFYYNKGKNKIRYILLSLGFIYLGLKHFRGITYLAIIFPLILGYNFRVESKDSNENISKRDKITYIISSIIIISLLIFNVRTSVNIPPELEKVANYLDNNTNKDVKIFTRLTDGGYLEYRGYKCYIDGRAEIYFKSNNKKEDIFIEYIDLLNGLIDTDSFIDKYQFDYLIIRDYDYILEKDIRKRIDYEVVYHELYKGKNIYIFKRIEKNE